jgi:hypothetical protein
MRARLSDNHPLASTTTRLPPTPPASGGSAWPDDTALCPVKAEAPSRVEGGREHSRVLVPRMRSSARWLLAGAVALSSNVGMAEPRLVEAAQSATAVPDEATAPSRVFTVKDASRDFDVTIRVARCDEQWSKPGGPIHYGFCRGAVSYAFHRKGSSRVFQVIEAPDTLIQLSDAGTPLVNQTRVYAQRPLPTRAIYDPQSAIEVGDFNFDGLPDVAVCTGEEGEYFMPSYDVYLASAPGGNFVHSRALSRLGKHLGMFEVDTKRRQLITFSKDTCCWHLMTRYTVVKDRPVKVFELEEKATIGGSEEALGAWNVANEGTGVWDKDVTGEGALLWQPGTHVTTRRLVGGKWRTTERDLGGGEDE